MKESLVKEAILASKSLMSNTKELPTLSAMEFVVAPHKQQLESFFSDSIHSISATRGRKPATTSVKIGNKVETFMVSRLKYKDLKHLHN